MKSSTLEHLVRREIRVSVIVPMLILSVATFVMVVRYALLESRERAELNVHRTAIAINQATIALEKHWRTSLEAAHHRNDLEASLRSLAEVDSNVCLLSIWQGDSLLFSHPRRDEFHTQPKTGVRWTRAQSDPRCDDAVVRHTIALDSHRIFVISFRLSRISRLFLDPHHHLDGRMTLVDANGVYIANVKSELVDQKEVDPLSGRLPRHGASSSGFNLEEGRLVGFSMRQLGGPPWTLIARQDTMTTAHSLFPLLGLMVLFLVISILAGARFRQKATSRILAPLENLRRSLDEIEVGRFENRLAPTGMSEIDNLTQAFNRMAVSIESREASRVKALERAVAGLEGFSYTVSHDLRSPLRAIDGFSRLLREDEAPHLSNEGNQAIERILAATQRMQRLIDDLLRLARTHRSSLSLEKVDIDALVQEVVKEESLRPGSERIRWEIAPLGSTHCDGGLVRQVWSNLLSNAIKYSSGQAIPHIRITRTESAESITWSVADNGVGFDPEHAGNLFGTFQRLHSEQDFEGTGIGLALVRSIVELHGGTVTGTGHPGKGATFQFNLPRTPSVAAHWHLSAAKG